MIPEQPKQFDPASQEGIMFDALSNIESDEYYIFHSLKISTVRDDKFYESETDFVIFHPQKGIICLEAKAGQVNYHDGQWFYGSGIPMHNDGPFSQASRNKWKLIRYFEDSRNGDLVKKCKFLHAVWFPSISQNDLNGICFPTEADKSIVLTKEALMNPQKYIDNIFEIDLPNEIETSLSHSETTRIIRKVLCPSFQIFPSTSFQDDLRKMVFHRLLREQSNVLNFLEEQKTAAINGAAGTGKTIIALEKAKKEAAKEEPVLFLCYNKMLRDSLAKKNDNEWVHFYTIDALACKMCNTAKPDYYRFKEVLEDCYISGGFPYKDVVIDEGQDFGQERMEDADILQLIHDIVADNDNSGSFFVFYDKLQNVQSEHLPKYIEDADSKLTLYRNCRNTENIAVTSLKPVSIRKPKLMENAVKGVPAKMYFCQTEDTLIGQIDHSIDSLVSDGIKDITILTCKTEQESILADKITNGKYRNKYLFTTYRKFKGLESDAIILIDVDDSTFNKENVMTYYVGTSRARLRLEMITQLSVEDCADILENKLEYKGRIRKAQRELASALNAVASLV